MRYDENTEILQFMSLGMDEVSKNHDFTTDSLVLCPGMLEKWSGEF